MRRLPVLGVSLIAAATLTGVAAAHVQVRPAEVAPGDSALFTVLVPNEKEKPTIQIDLKIPPGLIVFSFQETPGWARAETRRPNGSLEVVTWKGSLPPEEFVQFAFLASAPEKEGQISWPAVQTYAGGGKVRWIGPPDSEEPAAVTLVTKAASAENAGGEGAAAEPAAAGVSETTSETVSETGSPTWLSIVALVLGAVGLVVGSAALVAVRRRRV
jgi:uncharacterized protein YcnI